MSRRHLPSGEGAKRAPGFLGDDLFGASAPSRRASWIISYADMMTIILTFFILLLSISTIAQTKYELLVQAFTGRKQGTLQEVKEKIDAVVREQNLGGQLETKLTAKGLTLEFSNALLFSSGEAEMRETAEPVFVPIERHLVEDLEASYGLVIEGYTDDVPINNERFASNWELSTSRAIHVMNRLVAAGLDKRRVSVQGFADTRSATEEDIADTEAIEALAATQRERVRAANRRVIIRIDKLDGEVIERLSADGTLSEPAGNVRLPPSTETLKPFELPTVDPPKEAQP